MDNNNPTQTDFSVPSGIGFDAYSGSLQEILRDNIGKVVDIEFLIGSTSLQTRSGVLYAVGTSYVVIDQLPEKMVCDIYSIKFVTFRNTSASQSGTQSMQNNRPQNNSNNMRSGNVANSQSSIDRYNNYRNNSY